MYYYINTIFFKSQDHLNNNNNKKPQKKQSPMIKITNKQTKTTQSRNIMGFPQFDQGHLWKTNTECFLSCDQEQDKGVHICYSQTYLNTISVLSEYYSIFDCRS